MKKMIFFLAAVSVSAVLNGQITEWKNPEIVSVNREYPVTGFMSYTSRESAERNNYSDSPYYRLLDGVWKHKRFSSALELNEEVFVPDYAVSDWENIDIPQNSVADPVRKKGTIPSDTSVDVFRTEFHMPFAWADKQVFVELRGATSGVSVYVNGQKAGYAEDTRGVAAYDITTLVREGNNTLVIAATGWSTGNELEYYSLRSGGITESVCLKALPKIRVRDFEIRTNLTDNYRNGVLDFGVIVKSHLLNPKEARVYFELFSPDGTLLKSEYKNVALKMRQEQTVHFDALVPDVEAWSADVPNLYAVMIRIQHEGRYTEYIQRKIGFRSVEWTDGKILMNGKPIELRGVNVSDVLADPTMTEEFLRKMKQFHVNAIRPAHNPHPEYFYEWCDRYGFYVLSEADIDSRAYGVAPETTLGNNPAYLNAHMDRVKFVYERTKNYPSVVMFSLGDRGGNGYNFYEAYLWVKSCEKMRPVVYAGAGREWNTDVVIDREDPLRPMLTFEDPLAFPQGGFGNNFEVHEAFMPMELRLTDDGKVEIVNRSDFLPADKFELRYEVDRTKGVIPYTVEPGMSKVISLPKQGRRHRVELVVKVPFGIWQKGDVWADIAY